MLHRDARRLDQRQQPVEHPDLVQGVRVRADRDLQAALDAPAVEPGVLLDGSATWLRLR